MSHTSTESPAPAEPGCRLCYENGLLEGGEVRSKGKHWYLYVITDGDGKVTKAMINPIGHVSDVSLLIGDGSREFFAMWNLATRDLFPSRDFNVYSNQGGIESPTKGHTAGARIPEHLHVHLTPRLPGEPASDMGLALLIMRFNAVIEEITELAQHHRGQLLGDQLSRIAQRATAP